MYFNIYSFNKSKNWKYKDFCELGPGNGTLTKDLSKNLNKLIKDELNFYLFEKSNSLKKI